MAIEKYSEAIRVSNTPSLTEVINKKGFKLLSGIEGEGRWRSTDGLLALCREDINPNAEIPHPTTSPCSLLSFAGYAHFYKVMPSGFTQNESGRPDDYKDYIFEAQSDSAWIKVSVAPQGATTLDPVIKEFPFPWMPLSFRQGAVTLMRHLNLSWLTPDFVPGSSIPRIKLTRNTGVARKTYVGFDIESANGLVRRNYGVYITQLAIGDPGEGGGEVIPVYYPNFWVYSGVNAPIAENNSSVNPVLLRYGTFTFYIGGQTKLTSVVPLLSDNFGLTYQVSQYTTPNMSGDVGTITIAVPATANNSMIGFRISTSSKTITVYFGFNKQSA